jgi:hypothetical protein
MKKFMVVILMLLPILIAQTADAKPKAKLKDTPSYDIVAEYIRSLSAVHYIQQSATKELQEDRDDQVKMMMNSIRNFTRLKLELNASIGMLKGMTLKRQQFDQLIPMTISFYKEKIKLYDEAIKIAKEFVVTTPNPDVDYTKMATRMPEITANIEYIDESIFQSMVLVFGLLIDEKPDSTGHMSHLNITQEQRQTLIDRINNAFGESLEKENKNFTVASAALLKAYLQKDYISLDKWQHN